MKTSTNDMAASKNRRKPDKTNGATDKLKDLIQEEQNQGIQEYLESLTSTEAMKNSVWKATRKPRRSRQQNPSMKNYNIWVRNDKENVGFFQTSEKRLRIFSSCTSLSNQAQATGTQTELTVLAH
ncbi:hypothetical protein JTB14_019655 [Gonioctena quinquepunctata]|nr:hypothetical protein JTB14_019655 [Gonioctena quinquepunctata]